MGKCKENKASLTCQENGEESYSRGNYSEKKYFPLCAHLIEEI